MLTVNKMKSCSELYKLREDIGKHTQPVAMDYRIGDALKSPMLSHRDRVYDLDVYLEKYKMNLQRPYVWTYPQQNAFIQSIIYNKAITPFVIIQHNEENIFGRQIIYVIDGKQRLTTVHKFMNNEFSVEIGDKKYYYRDFDEDMKIYFNRNLDRFDAIVYYSYHNNPITDDEKIQIFNFYNFTGTPQAEEHKIKLQNLLKNE